MNDLINKINALNKMKRKFFVETVFYEEKLDKEFLNILKKVDPEILKSFLKDLPKEGKEFWNRSIEEVEEMYMDMEEVFKAIPTWSKYIITSHRGFERLIRKDASRKRKLYNGRIQCNYYQYHGLRPKKGEFNGKNN